MLPEKPSTKRLKEILLIVKRTFDVYKKHDMAVYSGYTTFYLMMSVVPLLMLIISLINFLPWFSIEEAGQILTKLIPDVPQIRQVLLDIIVNLNRRSGQMISSVFALTSFWSGSHGVSAMMAGLEKINHTQRESLTKKLRAIVYTILFILLIPSMLLFQVLRGSIHNGITLLFTYLNILETGSYINRILRLSSIVTLAAMILVIVLTLTHLPTGKRTIRSQLPGSIFTCVLWVVFTNAFGLFIRRFWRMAPIYGTLASFFLTGFWLKIIITILFYGASLNRAIQVKVSKDCST